VPREVLQETFYLPGQNRLGHAGSTVRHASIVNGTVGGWHVGVAEF
jgi:hypothetical protein